MRLLEKKAELLQRSGCEWDGKRGCMSLIVYSVKLNNHAVRKPIRKKHIQIILVSLILGVISRTTFGAVIGYEEEINKINTLMAMHHDKKALVEATKFYSRTNANYESTILLSRTQIANNNITEAIISLKKLSLKFPNNKEIINLLRRYNQIKEVDELKAMFNEKKYEESIKLGAPLFRNNIDSYRTGLIIAQSQFRLGKIDKAVNVYNQLIKLFPNDNILKNDLRHLQALQAFKEANAQIDKKHFNVALGLLKPFYYKDSPDKKSAGYLMAKIYCSEGENKKCIDIYKELVKNYPNDAGLSIEFMNKLLDTYHNDAALNYYHSIPKVNRTAILNRVGNNLSKYYTNYLMVYGGAAQSTRGYPVDNQVGVAINKTFEGSALYLSVNRWSRFNEAAMQIDGVYYFSLKHGYSGFIGGSFSPENNFLAHYSLTTGISKSIKNINYYGSIRQLEYTALSATVLSGGLRYYFQKPISIGLTLYYIPQTTAYSIMISPKWNLNNTDELYANLSWGMAGENLGVNIGILKTPSANIQIGDSYRIAPHVSIGGEVFYEYRKALYNRTGGIGYISYWW